MVGWIDPARRTIPWPRLPIGLLKCCSELIGRAPTCAMVPGSAVVSAFLYSCSLCSISVLPSKKCVPNLVSLIPAILTLLVECLCSSRQQCLLCSLVVSSTLLRRVSNLQSSVVFSTLLRRVSNLHSFVVFSTLLRRVSIFALHGPSCFTNLFGLNVLGQVNVFTLSVPRSSSTLREC